MKNEELHDSTDIRNLFLDYSTLMLCSNLAYPLQNHLFKARYPPEILACRCRLVAVSLP